MPTSTRSLPEDTPDAALALPAGARVLPLSVRLCSTALPGLVPLVQAMCRNVRGTLQKNGQRRSSLMRLRCLDAIVSERDLLIVRRSTTLEADATSSASRRPLVVASWDTALAMKARISAV